VALVLQSKANMQGTSQEDWYTTRENDSRTIFHI